MSDQPDPHIAQKAPYAVEVGPARKYYFWWPGLSKEPALLRRLAQGRAFFAAGPSPRRKDGTVHIACKHAAKRRIATGRTRNCELAGPV